MKSFFPLSALLCLSALGIACTSTRSLSQNDASRFAKENKENFSQHKGFLEKEFRNTLAAKNSRVDLSNTLYVPPSVFLVLTEGKKTQVVLSQNPEPAWRVGEPQLVSLEEGDYTVVRHDVDQQKMPESFSRLENQKMRFFSKEGKMVCEALVDKFSIINRVYPMYETREAWMGTYSNLSWKPEDIALHAFSISEQRGEILTADTVATEEACAEAFWAYPVLEQDPLFVSFQPAESFLRKTTMEQVYNLSVYQEIQKSYQSEIPKSAQVSRWEEHGGQTPDVSVLYHSKSDTMLVSFMMKRDKTSEYKIPFAGYPGVEGNFWALWEVKNWPENPKFILRNDPSMPWIETLPKSALIRNGEWEFLYSNGFLKMNDGIYQLIETLPVIFEQPYNGEEYGGC